MKRLGIAIILTVIVNNLFGQQDLFVGSSYQFSLQRQNAHGDAWILHNAEYSQDPDLLKWKTTHSSFGARGIRFNYGSGGGIYFYADYNSTVSGTNFNPTTRFFIGNNGNVGIGTTNPFTKLEVLSGASNNEIARFGGTVSARGLRLSSFAVDGTNEVGFNFDAPGAGGAAAISFSTLSAERMRINYNGNVGIGTTTPSYPLSIVNSTSSTTAYKLWAGRSVSSEGLGFAVDDNGAYIKSVQDETGSESHGLTFDVVSAATGDHYIRFSTNGSEKMRINSSGKIGIGTTAPVSKLTSINSVNNYSAFFGYGSTSSNDIGGIGFITDGSNYYKITTDYWTTVKNYPLILGTYYNNSNQLVLATTGNVGIGTTTPQNKLDVLGVIRCTEVKVEAPWADFVFHPTYKLRTLGEVEQFIKANNHLPEIPTESEVKQNGIGLGEMNAKLLQKIEELTLYMIQKDKESKLQAEQLKQQDESIKLMQQELEKLKNSNTNTNN